jgi:hypothetical protein
LVKPLRSNMVSSKLESREVFEGSEQLQIFVRSKFILRHQTQTHIFGIAVSLTNFLRPAKIMDTFTYSRFGFRRRLLLLFGLGRFRLTRFIAENGASRVGGDIT